MPFLLLEELYVRRGQAECLRLAGSIAGAGEPNLPRIAAAIAAAEAEAVSYLTARYPAEQLPATPEACPGVLKDKVAVLAHRHLAGAVQVAPALEAEAAEARTWLRAVARGTANLGLQGQPQVDRGTARVLLAQTNPGTALTFGTLEDW
jgi:phage gp36-like protein